MQLCVSLNQFLFPLCVFLPCHATPAASQQCLIKAAAQQTSCWCCPPATSGLQIGFYLLAEIEASPGTWSLCVIRGNSGAVRAAGKGTETFIWLIVFGLTGNSYFQIGACVSRHWVLSLKMQSYLLLSPLSVLFLSPWQNSSFPVNQGDLNCRVVFVRPRNCYRTITVIVSCILWIGAVQCAGSQLCVQHVFKGIPASEHNRRKGPDSQQPWFQHSLSNVTRGLIKLGVMLCTGTHDCTGTLPETEIL